MEEQKQTVYEFAKEKGNEQMLDGEKMRMDDVLGKDIIVTGHKALVDKFSKREGDMVTLLQFTLENKKCVTFTRSSVLTAQLLAMKEKTPFKAKIVKQKRYLTFQ